MVQGFLLYFYSTKKSGWLYSINFINDPLIVFLSYKTLPLIDLYMPDFHLSSICLWIGDICIILHLHLHLSSQYIKMPKRNNNWFPCFLKYSHLLSTLALRRFQILKKTSSHTLKTLIANWTHFLWNSYARHFSLSGIHPVILQGKYKSPQTSRKIELNILERWLNELWAWHLFACSGFYGI